MTPTLSIAIPAYNVRKYLRAAVDSALAQTRTDLEVLVVDDGSRDGSAETLADVTDPRLKIIRQENQGLSAARNTGIRAATGRFVGFLDGDDLWRPEKAAKQLAEMERDPTLGLTFSHSEYTDEEGRVSGRVLATTLMRPTLADMIVRNHVGNGSNAIVRRDLFDVAGLFDVELRAGEDYEMWVRLLGRCPGYGFLCIPEPLTLYRNRATSLSNDFEAAAASWVKAVAKARRSAPQIADGLFRRGEANMYRVAARKAISGGNRAVALRLMSRAVQLAPSLLLTDYRTIGTFALIAMHGIYVEKSLSTSSSGGK